MHSLHQGRQYRTLFISDVHLGTSSCKADALARFLRAHDADAIFLVGDIIDIQRDRPRARWPQAQRDVIRLLLVKAQAGARIIVIPGNHDAPLREFCASQWDAIEVHADYDYVTATGKRFLVTHGDQFDVLMRTPSLLLRWGDRLRSGVLRLADFDRASSRRRAGMAARLKITLDIVGGFERAAAREAKRRGADGIICGHIHHAADRLIDGVHYLNCGDWVSSCAAIVETHAGEMTLLRWPDREQQAEAGAPAIHYSPCPAGVAS